MVAAHDSDKHVSYLFFLRKAVGLQSTLLLLLLSSWVLAWLGLAGTERILLSLQLFSKTVLAPCSSAGLVPTEIKPTKEVGPSNAKCSTAAIACLRKLRLKDPKQHRLIRADGQFTVFCLKTQKSSLPVPNFKVRFRSASFSSRFLQEGESACMPASGHTKHLRPAFGVELPFNCLASSSAGPLCAWYGCRA